MRIILGAVEKFLDESKINKNWIKSWINNN